MTTGYILIYSNVICREKQLTFQVCDLWDSDAFYIGVKLSGLKCDVSGRILHSLYIFMLYILWFVQNCQFQCISSGNNFAQWIQRRETTRIQANLWHYDKTPRCLAKHWFPRVLLSCDSQRHCMRRSGNTTISFLEV